MDDLEAERDFLLRSIEDLDAESDAGDLPPERHRELVEDYTARAASVLRTIAGGATPPAPAPNRSRRKVGVVAALVAVAVTAGVLLPRAVGQRFPGQTITGNAQITEDRDSLRQAVRNRPADPKAHLAYGRFLMGSGAAVDALEEFDDAARLDPGDAESRAYGGWILFLAGLTDESMGRLDAAEAANPAYPDAHFFRAVALLRGRNQPTAAVPELERYLELVPDGPLRAQVQQLLAQARSAGAQSPTPPVPPVPPVPLG